MIDERHGDMRRQPPPDQITKNDDDTSLRLAEEDKFARGRRRWWRGGTNSVPIWVRITHAREAEMLHSHAVAGGLVARQQGKQSRQETMRQLVSRHWTRINEIAMLGAALWSEVELYFNEGQGYGNNWADGSCAPRHLKAVRPKILMTLVRIDLIKNSKSSNVKLSLLATSLVFPSGSS